MEANKGFVNSIGAAVATSQCSIRIQVKDPCQASHAIPGERGLDSGFSVLLTWCRANPQLCRCGGSEKEGKKEKYYHVPLLGEAHIPAFPGNPVFFHVLPHSRAGMWHWLCAATAFIPVLLQLQGLLLLRQGEQTSPCLPSPPQSTEKQEQWSVHGNPVTQSSQAEPTHCC